VVVRVAIEESEDQIKDSAFFNQIKDFYEASLSLCVLSGYALFLVESKIDPIDTNLVVNIETNELGNLWFKEYEKNEHKDLLLEIDPILSMFLEKIKQDEIDKMLTEYEDMAAASFKDVSVIDTFLNWSLHQGFILAMLEQKLLKNTEHERK